MDQPFNDLVQLMAQLRAPDGCPWDRQQTHESLKPYLLEETYEVLEAIDRGEAPALKDELGDLLLQILFHAQIASEQSRFTFQDVADHLAQKLIRRHPHVFQKEGKARGITMAEEVIQQWEDIKRAEQAGKPSQPSSLAEVSKGAPALQRAYKVQKAAARSGVDWSTLSPVMAKLREELDELFSAVTETTDRAGSAVPEGGSPEDRQQIEAELGDVLFSLVNVARFLQVNPEEALRQSTNRFIRRFDHLEQRAREHGQFLRDCSASQLDHWWEEAKQREDPPLPSHPLGKPQTELGH